MQRNGGTSRAPTGSTDAKPNTDCLGRRAGTVYHDSASTAGSAIPQSTPRYTGGSVADSGYLPATTAPDPGYAVFRPTEDPQPPATSTAPAAIPPTRSRGRERRSRPGPRRTRRGSRRVGGRSPDDDSEGPSDSDPPPLALRIVGTAGDDSAVESAFLSILNRRHPSARWELVV